MNFKLLIDQDILAPLEQHLGLPVISGIAIDSRQVVPGDMFVAISGSNTKGLDFVEIAISAGASCILIDEQDDLHKAREIMHKVPVYTCRNIRKVTAHLVSQLSNIQLDHCVAVTGTNGKSSVVSFVRQLWGLLGQKAASLGTLGIETEGVESPFAKARNQLTTPDVVTLHKQLKIIEELGVNHVAFEASSHGLDQYRLEGVPISIAAFTNFSQDHLDYHGSMEAYFQSKARLFKELLSPVGVAVINLLDPRGEDMLSLCRKRQITTVTVGHEGSDLCIDPFTSKARAEAGIDEQVVHFTYKKKAYQFILPIPGSYQIENILVSIGILLADGFSIDDILKACEQLKPIPGRLEPVRPGVYVDYAHTPEALRSAIEAVPHKKGNLWVVFGCGGNRDPEKRKLMGEVVNAPEFRGKVIITDDNPREENPAAIRREIREVIPWAMEVADRGKAIKTVMSLRYPEDKVLIAGKGHETYQLIGKDVCDFDDREEVRKAMALWNWKEAEEATGGKSSHEWEATGLSIDTRTLKPGDVFIALDGDSSNGHAYVQAAFEKGAAAAMVSEDLKIDKPLLKVNNTLRAIEAMGDYARQRAKNAKRIAITGSVGKTSTKEMLKLALSTQGLTHASVSSYNNHWGVPLSLARMPRDTEFAIFEVGMNHPGEITPLTQMIKPHVALITSVGASHLGHFESVLEIAKAKAEIFQGVVEEGAVILNADNEYFSELVSKANSCGIKNLYTFGHSQSCDAILQDDNHQVCIDGAVYELAVADNGSHMGQNGGAVLLAVRVIGGDVSEANVNLGYFQPVEGRGDVHLIKGDRVNFTLINESYNANPSSMEAALSVLGSRTNARKIAVIGDMRELGKDADQLHERLLDPILKCKIDLVFCCGPHMAKLYEKLPSKIKAGYTEASIDLIPLVTSALKEEDVVMIKGSLGTRMKPIVTALMAMNINESSRGAVN